MLKLTVPRSTLQLPYRLDRKTDKTTPCIWHRPNLQLHSSTVMRAMSE